MIQDIEPYKYIVEYKDIKPQDEDMIVIFRNDKIFVHEESGDISYPTWSEVKALAGEKAVRYLFEIEGAGKLFIAEDDLVSGSVGVEKHADNLHLIGLSQREIQECSPKWAAFAGTTAFQFARWYESNRLCGKCGAKMKHAEKERMLYCGKCQEPVYPRINPVVIVGVTDGDRILLTRYARGEYRRYALVAGFAEAGETIEETVCREVYEETGVHVKNIRFYKSQPWSMSDSLLLGFFCDLDGSPKVSLNDGELEIAEWVKREDVPDYDDSVALTAAMMRAFKYQK